jgi:hypothetical protein
MGVDACLLHIDGDVLFDLRRSNAAIRWTIIPIGAAFGYISGRVAQPIAMMMFEPQGMFVHTYPS